MKYVIVNKAGVELAILFPDQIQHSEAVDQTKVKVVAAGFMREMPDGNLACYGDSVSLGKTSRGADDMAAMAAIEFTIGLMLKPREPGVQHFGVERGVGETFV